MTLPDTSLGGPGRGFPTTRWSAILAAADPTDAGRMGHLDGLLRAYWKPVFGYIRAAWGRTVEDAKDLTQGFFAEMLRRDLMARVRPDLGSFRAYLKRALRNYLIDAERAEAVRRPEAPVLSLEASPGELERLGPAAPGESPEQVFDREWFNAVLDASVTELRERCAAEGKQVPFDVFWTYCLEPETKNVRDAGEKTYKDVADQFGVTVTDVGHYIAYCREALREILRARVRDYVTSQGDVEIELAEVLRR